MKFYTVTRLHFFAKSINKNGNLAGKERSAWKEKERRQLTIFAYMCCIAAIRILKVPFVVTKIPMNAAKHEEY